MMKGEKEFYTFLRALPEDLQKKGVRAGVTAALAVYRKGVRSRAPKEQGLYAKSIRSSSRIERDGTVRGRVFPDRKKTHGWLGPILEYGSAPHFISAGDSNLSARKLTAKAGREGVSGEGTSLKIGDKFVNGGVFHPGTRAMPHFRPTMDVDTDAAIDAFAVRIRSYFKDKTGFTAPSFDLDMAA